MITNAPIADTDYRIFLKSKNPQVEKFRTINIYWPTRGLGVTTYAAPIYVQSTVKLETPNG